MWGYCDIPTYGYNHRMMTSTLVETIRAEIQSRKGSLKAVAERTGVPYSTLVKIGQGYTTNPTLDTAEALMRDFGIVCAIPDSDS